MNILGSAKGMVFHMTNLIINTLSIFTLNVKRISDRDKGYKVSFQCRTYVVTQTCLSCFKGLKSRKHRDFRNTVFAHADLYKSISHFSLLFCNV